MAQLIDPESASNNLAQRRTADGDLWLIMERAPGHSLREFCSRVNKSVLSMSDTLQLALHLTRILQRVHERGVEHHHVSPDHVMIEWDSKKQPISEAQLTLLSFSQASSLQKWYEAPPAGVCAIVFWLLTTTEPRHDADTLPHQQQRQALDRVINDAVVSGRKSSPSLDFEQLSVYLTDTFDHGFGHPHHHQPWTLGDLECRLEAILELLSPSQPTFNTADAIFQALASTSDTTPPSTTVTDGARRDALAEVSKAFCEAKQHFVEDAHHFSWSDGWCSWMQSPSVGSNEYRHDDVLTFQSFFRNKSINCAVIITCWTSFAPDGRTMTLSIGSSACGKMIRVPLLQCPTAVSGPLNVREIFGKEVKNLLVGIYKQRVAVQP